MAGYAERSTFVGVPVDTNPTETKPNWQVKTVCQSAYFRSAWQFGHRSPSEMAWVASCVTQVQSPVAMASAVDNHDPPTQPTVGSAR